MAREKGYKSGRLDSSVNTLTKFFHNKAQPQLQSSRIQLCLNTNDEADNHRSKER